MKPVEILASVNNLLRFIQSSHIKLWCREQRGRMGDSQGACTILEYEGKRYVLMVKEINQASQEFSC
jgi:hypothetical protein